MHVVHKAEFSMPQLDRVTFLSQFVWLCIFYLGLYVVVYKTFLPKLSRILAVRKRKMGLSHHSIEALNHEHGAVHDHVNAMFARALGTSRHMFHTLVAQTTSWVGTRVEAVNTTHYQGVNTAYLHTLGETSLSHHLGLYHAGHHHPQQVVLALLVDTLKAAGRRGASRDVVVDGKKSKKLK